MSSSVLLLLADGRFPAGGHAHSGGVEEAITDGRITVLADLRAFVAGRLETVGLVAASLAAAATALAVAGGREVEWRRLDAEAEARVASPTLRRASRRQGRQMMRAAHAVWPGPEVAALAAAVPAGPHQPLALGVAAAAAGLVPLDTALVAAQESVAGPAVAGLRLLGLDPLDATRIVADSASRIDDVARAAADHAAAGDWRRLPAATPLLIEIGAERHAQREVRLFAT